MKLNDMTTPELLSERQRIENDPASRNPAGGLFIFSPAARRKLDKIDHAITANLRAAKLARGEYVNDEGYSGRQSNRR